MNHTEIRDVLDKKDTPDEFIHSHLANLAWFEYGFGYVKAHRWAELVWDFELSFDEAACQVDDEWRSRS